MAEGGAGAAGRPASGGERGPPAGRPPARRGARSKARPPQPPQARPPAARGAAILAPGGPSAAIGRYARGVADPPIVGGHGRDAQGGARPATLEGREKPWGARGGRGAAPPGSCRRGGLNDIFWDFGISAFPGNSRRGFILALDPAPLSCGVLGPVKWLLRSDTRTVSVQTFRIK